MYRCVLCFLLSTKAHQTVSLHLFVWDHTLALILLSGPLQQQSQCGCRSGAGVDELAVPCQVPPEVFSLPHTDLPKKWRDCP